MKRGASAGKYIIKSCGNRHSWCNICKPDRKNPWVKDHIPAFRKRKVQLKLAEIRLRTECLAGKNNPNYRGGVLKRNGVGWNKARRLVWKRDKVCRVCGFPPHLLRRFDVHHIVAERNGGTNDPSNLVGLHHSCHMKVEFGKVVL